MGPEWQTAGLNGSKFTYDIQQLAYRPQLQGGVPSVLDDQERHRAGIWTRAFTQLPGRTTDAPWFAI